MATGKKVHTMLSDLDTAAIEEPLRATLLMLGKLVREHTVDANEIRQSSLPALRVNRSRMPSLSASHSM